MSKGLDLGDRKIRTCTPTWQRAGKTQVANADGDGMTAGESSCPPIGQELRVEELVSGQGDPLYWSWETGFEGR